MEFLVNLIFAVIAYLLAKYLVIEAGGRSPLPVVVGVIAAVVVFFMNLAAHFV